MDRMTINYHRKVSRGESPVPYVVIETLMGNRAYAPKELAQVFELSGHFADGSIIADGSYMAGSGAGVLEKSGRLLSLSGITRELQPRKTDLLSAFTSKSLQHISITLDNTDRIFARLLPNEPMLGRPLAFFLGFEDLGFFEHLRKFGGTISEITLQPTRCIIEADEA